MSAGSPPSRGAPKAAAAVITERAGRGPRVGVVLGSGLGAAADAVSDPTVIDYADLPGFPRPTVAGHGGRAVLGEIADVPVAILQGRGHVYEGGDLDKIRTPVRALRAAGAEILVLTNAAGSLRPEIGPGRLMMITDHINLSGVNVLAGPNDDEIGPRFPSLQDAYDPELRDRLRRAAGELGTDLAEGIYLAVSGPTFETPAEIRAYATLGADAVGMSTVHETAVARHCGLRVAAVSAITNLAEGMHAGPLSHEQTLLDAQRAADELAPLLVRFVEGLAE
jgi:xanthosine phosphorylase